MQSIRHVSQARQFLNIGEELKQTPSGRVVELTWLSRCWPPPLEAETTEDEAISAEVEEMTCKFVI